jgi:diguanylate cyclase (GGDEF)-like protein/PAS domain S-box-containing protein
MDERPTWFGEESTGWRARVRDAGSRLDGALGKLYSWRAGAPQRYGAAAAMVCAAWALRAAMMPAAGGLQFVTFFPAVAVSAVFLGGRAGVLATFLGALAASYAYFAPFGAWSWTFEPGMVAALAIFVGDGLTVSASVGGLRRYVARNKRLAAELSARLEESRSKQEEARVLEAALDEHALMSVADSTGKIVYANENFCKALGYKKEELLGATHAIVRSGDHCPEFYRQVDEAIGAGKVWRGDMLNRRRDGSSIWMSTTIVPIAGKGGKPERFVSIRADVSAHKGEAEKERSRAMTDALTKLPNRRHFDSWLEEAVAAQMRKEALSGAKLGAAKVAVVFFDLDGFKLVNDSMGHAAGDDLLARVGARLATLSGPDQFCARLGGDEFALAICADEPLRAALDVGGRVLARLGGRYELKGGSCSVGTSVGSAVWPEHGSSVSELMRAADSAMYEAKRAGGSRVVVYGGAAGV